MSSPKPDATLYVFGRDRKSIEHFTSLDDQVITIIQFDDTGTLSMPPESNGKAVVIVATFDSSSVIPEIFQDRAVLLLVPDGSPSDSYPDKKLYTLPYKKLSQTNWIFGDVAANSTHELLTQYATAGRALADAVELTEVFDKLVINTRRDVIKSTVDGVVGDIGFDRFNKKAFVVDRQIRTISMSRLAMDHLFGADTTPPPSIDGINLTTSPGGDIVVKFLTASKLERSRAADSTFLDKLLKPNDILLVGIAETENNSLIDTVQKIATPSVQCIATPASGDVFYATIAAVIERKNATHHMLRARPDNQTQGDLLHRIQLGSNVYKR